MEHDHERAGDVRPVSLERACAAAAGAGAGDDGGRRPDPAGAAAVKPRCGLCEWLRELDRRLQEAGDELRETVRVKWILADAQARQALIVGAVAVAATLLDLWKLRLTGGRGGGP